MNSADSPCPDPRRTATDRVPWRRTFRRRCAAVAAWAAVAIAVVLGYGGAAAPRKDPVDELQLVFPPRRAVVFWGTIDLILKGSGELKVDGRPQRWEDFQAPLRVARLGLEPGPHQIQIGQRRLDLFVSLGPDERDWPDGWPVYRLHTAENGPDRCNGCHKTTREQGEVVVGRWKGATACATCHRARDLEEAHGRPVKEIHSCPTCHDVHASQRKGLLKPSVKAGDPR